MIEQKSESTQRPIEIDETSSDTVVYVRSDVVEELRNDNGNTITMYRYRETVYSKDEYEKAKPTLEISRLQKEKDELEQVMAEMIQLLADKGVIW